MGMHRLLPFFAVIAAALTACAGDDTASAGRSFFERTAASAPRGATDLGREAEKEEEELRKREKLPALQK